MAKGNSIYWIKVTAGQGVKDRLMGSPSFFTTPAHIKNVYAIKVTIKEIGDVSFQARCYAANNETRHVHPQNQPIPN